MNKKNFPIFISVFIVSLFFTVVFYYSYSSVSFTNREFRSVNYEDAYIEGGVKENELAKIRSNEYIDEAGFESYDCISGKIEDDILAIPSFDQSIASMKSDYSLKEGRYPNNFDEIVLSENVIKDKKLRISDKVEVDFGQRTLNGKIVNPTYKPTSDEEFTISSSKELKIVGILKDKPNGISQANILIDPNYENKLTAIKFKSLYKAYDNQDLIEEDLSRLLGRKIKVEFEPAIVDHYYLYEDTIGRIGKELSTIFLVVLAIGIFVFFNKNIFLIWSLEKIKVLSMYKSIGSTDFQILGMLFKESVMISILPLSLGHIVGYVFIRYYFGAINNNFGIDVPTSVDFNLLLSLAIILISLLIIFISLAFTLRKIKKIEIIYGLKGIINLKKSKKKRANTIFKELRINNLASIKSQSYISTIGVLIISVLFIFISFSSYSVDWGFYEDDYNLTVDYFSNDPSLPNNLSAIDKSIDSKKSFIYQQRNLSIENNLDFSEEFFSNNLDEFLYELNGREEDNTILGKIVGLREEDLNLLGGNKGEYILYNMIQSNPEEPLRDAKMVKFFKDPKKLDLITASGQKTSIDISKNIDDLKDLTMKISRGSVCIFTDFDTYFKLLEATGNGNLVNYPFTLKMQVNPNKIEPSKEAIKKFLDQNPRTDESFEIHSAGDRADEDDKLLGGLLSINFIMASIILALNFTNGYASINSSLMARKREIGNLYSIGIEKDDLKKILEQEFIFEQVKSFALAILVTFAVIISLSILSPRYSLLVFIKYYNHLTFLGFSLLVYVINILIYHLSLKRILDKPTIDLIRAD
ncbi:ABC transporter permease [uncultured Anaerococcus sp.]|uniref:ABC transporter permease n=1 Tax=uncultured Anaerococcus sp. TaxID=293428 RepID=UPI0025D41FB6|nr:ABC transporter permease [uncultured Anaerococcus sp.]